MNSTMVCGCREKEERVGAKTHHPFYTVNNFFIGRLSHQCFSMLKHLAHLVSRQDLDRWLHISIFYAVRLSIGTPTPHVHQHLAHMHSSSPIATLAGIRFRQMALLSRKKCVGALCGCFCAVWGEATI